ncbi:MAG: GGDEF domain-containing protein [Rubrivivax sp.]
MPQPTLTLTDSRPSAWTGALDAAVAREVQRSLGHLWPLLAERTGGRLVVKDAGDGSYLWVDPALAHDWGFGADAPLGHSDADTFDAATAAALRSAEQTAAARSDPLCSEHRFERAGRRHAYQVLRVGVAGAAEPPRCLVSVWIDETPARRRDQQLRQALEQLEQLQHSHAALQRDGQDQALRDDRSGLYTPGLFEDQLRREMDLSTRDHREFSLVFVEIDPPPADARTLGDAALARVHEAMGRLLRGNTRAMDASCRLDARRFAVLLSGVGLATAHARMEGLRRQCAAQIVVLDGRELGFSVAMGVASFPHTAHDQDELVAACESALAEARRRGGNRVTLASIRFEGA